MFGMLLKNQIKQTILQIVFFVVCGAIPGLFAQEEPKEVLTYKDYMNQVKKFHPVVKQANLLTDIGDAQVQQARGDFDPKLEAYYDRKDFKDIEYYDILNATFKIPTWFGVELKANFEQNQGEFLNPQLNVPEEGLFAAGVSVPLAQGLLINKRMASLRKAKFYREQNRADRDLLVNEVLFEASLAYFSWLRYYNETQIYEDFLENASVRLTGIRTRARLGDIAAIDTVEAKIAVQNRQLSLEQAKISQIKAALELSNYLWIQDNIPVELLPDVIPEQNINLIINNELNLDILDRDAIILENHPKMRSLANKIGALEVERRLQLNTLLPKINVNYNFITSTPDLLSTYNENNYKAGVTFSFPLFLRKERGSLRIARYELQDQEYERTTVSTQLTNKIDASFNTLDALKVQLELITDIVSNYQVLLSAEERKFSFGESSLFLINSRESKLIDARLKSNELQNKYFDTKAKLFNNLAIVPEEVEK
ncbi:TolC family protein [Aquimarina sp. ERC-38]|uniref:TolC family protein n=1 Tax=Aquimarina sp. ERC-38 TaxID=2949996 RepID=UPI0022472C5D|nr:TolC family protein [Aquimarina sp. ERC-38]UZO82457.1 TolC family protein [Aquimarina sp. ERC-38]